MAHADDLARYRPAAEAFIQGATALRPAAERAGCSVSALHDTLTRLEAQYQRTLVFRGDKSTPTRLTPDGQALYDALRAFEDFAAVQSLINDKEDAPPRPRLRVALSRSLFTSPLLFPEMSDEFRNIRKTTELELDFGEHVDFSRALGGIERNELDVLLVWVLKEGASDTDRAQPIRTPGLVRESVIPARIDVVFVAANAADIGALNVTGDPDRPFDEAALVTRAVATVTRDLEPDSVRAVLPVRSKGGRRVPVGSIEAALTYTRAGIVDYAIVPAVYRELDHYRRLGQLFYSRPIARAGVDLVTHKSAESNKSLRHVREFTAAVKKVIRNLSPENKIRLHYTNHPCWGDSPDEPSHVFPVDEGWFSGFRHGYFVSHLHDAHGRVQPRTDPRWRCERLELAPAAPDAGEQGTAYDIRILNQDTDEFLARGRLFANVFIVTATPRVPNPEPPVYPFCSVFSWCDRPAGIMYGTWRGLDDGGRPVAFSTIWSHRELDIRDLQVIALHAMNTIGVTATKVDATEVPDWPKRPPGGQPLPPSSM